MTDVWQYWRDALAGKAPAIDANSPQCGFYKKRDAKGGAWLPVMIRFDETGALRCRVGSNSDADPHDVWTWCAERAISKEDAKHAFETGSFPGDVAGIGGNSPPDLSLADQIKECAAQALAWLRKAGITDTRSKDMAANYRAELLRLRNGADAARDAEKRPHLEAGRAVDAKFRPLVEEADAAANELRDALTVFMRDEEKRLEAERRAKWEAEQKAAASARAAVEAQRAKMERDDPIAAMTGSLPELPEPPPPPEPVKVQAGGQRGRKTGLRIIKKYRVTDRAAVFAFFQDHDEVRELLLRLASRASAAGASVPGVEAYDEKVAA